MFTPTPTAFFYEPQKITGQEELGLIVMLCISGIMFFYFALKVSKREKKEE